MTRTRAFDEEVILTGAMLAFRQHGLAGVSVRDLERATGISAGSLYNAYGNKDGLYRAAFAHYFRIIIEPRLASTGTLDDLERLFLGLFELPMADGHGCLVTNAAIEFGPAPSVAADFVARGLDVLEVAISAVLRREIGDEAAGLATLRLVLFYQGILVLSRAGRRTDALVPVIRAEFDQLRSMRRRHSTPN
jgi:AcrR family transcriptional regulator